MTAVYDALTTLDGLRAWWMPDVDGEPASRGGEVTFRFDDDHVTMRVDHLEPTLVVWTCTESTKFAEWIDTRLWWELRHREDAGTEIEFRQVGLLQECECYGECSRGWNHFVVSLAEFAAGSGGHPRGSDGWETARSAR
ncbi:MAG TPA: SRPBCC domain-containing protein [Acidimicrobiia bacterium]